MNNSIRVMSRINWFSRTHYDSSNTNLGYLFLITAGSRLHRGYCFEAVMDDKPTDITHLVFVIHGIGQKMDTGHIVRCSQE